MPQKKNPPPDRFPDGTPLNAEWRLFLEQFMEHTVYLGDKNEAGAWRITRSGNDLHFDRLESGSWVNKGSFTA
jgi:hypothetical protein